MSNNFIAHVRKNAEDQWATPQSLEDHLSGTARLASVFASKFLSSDWGKAAGIAHDIGKGRPEWQKYLRLKSGFFDEEAHMEGKPGKKPHAIYGALLAERHFGPAIGRVLSYCIAGHHAGLPDWDGAESTGKSALEYQLTTVKDLATIEQQFADNLNRIKAPVLPRKFSSGLDLSLWIRMLYSCLVDADFLDTESYMNAEKANTRGNYLCIPALQVKLNSYYQELIDHSTDTPINRIRRDVYNKCLKAAQELPGFFSLSVPTGGGKTLSSLAFALEHGKIHNLDRIIYVIPYTSIIEQNADVFRKALGDDQVVEHHSSLDVEASTAKSRLAAENWDAPVIVTTSVQFFESLFAAKSSRCRKLHNIVNSVVVLDEAQLVPVEYLAPILETIQLLADYYRVSFVFSTATQPAFKERPGEGQPYKGLKNVREIIGTANEVTELYNSLRRVKFQLPSNIHTPTSWEEIASELIEHKQVLCVVSDRKSCRALHQLMPEGTYHLSALMCGQHRSDTIAEIKENLINKNLVRVISTQLVEAGVDLDFPVVYRALAGLDSIAQAAGRCNREGSPTKGSVVVFVAPKNPPPGILRKATDTTVGIMLSDPEMDPLDHNLFARFFSDLYNKAISLDAKDIVTSLQPSPTDLGINFRSAAKNFRIIDDSLQEPVLVPYGEGKKLINKLKYGGPNREILRRLQRFTVNVYTQEFNLMRQRSSIVEVQPNIFALQTDKEYSDTIGLMIDDICLDPGELVI